MFKRNFENSMQALADGNFEIAVEEFNRESCDSKSIFCPYKTAETIRCKHAPGCMSAYLKYLSLSSCDKNFENIVSTYVVWEQASRQSDPIIGPEG